LINQNFLGAHDFKKKKKSFIKDPYLSKLHIHNSVISKFVNIISHFISSQNFLGAHDFKKRKNFQISVGQSCNDVIFKICKYSFSFHFNQKFCGVHDFRKRKKI